jgi:hypothetical protein
LDGAGIGLKLGLLSVTGAAVGASDGAEEVGETV